MLKFCDHQAYFGGRNCLLDVLNCFVNIIEFYFIIFRSQSSEMPDHSARILNDFSTMLFLTSSDCQRLTPQHCCFLSIPSVADQTD